MSRTERAVTSWQLGGDIAVAVLLAVSVLLATAQIEPSAGDRSLDVLGYGVVVIACGALAARRRRPLAVVIVVTAALCIYLLRNYDGGPIFVTAWVALYSLASTGDRRRAFAAAIASSALLIGIGLVADTGPGLIHLVFVGWAAAAVFLGEARESRRRHIVELEERARDLEQTREEEVRRRLVEDRVRIARDLHDSVAHSMATINVQAGTAAHVIDRHPEQAGQALTAIKQVSAEVLDELTAMLEVLRLNTAEQPSLAPTPDLDQLEDLVSSTRRAGLEVYLSVTPPFGDVPRPIAIAAYRIVQESLTNVVRHAGSARASVTVTGRGSDGLSVEIVDVGEGTVAPTAGTGVGIVGMRERAESSGGTLAAGPRPGGGFGVLATWPGRA